MGRRVIPHWHDWRLILSCSLTMLILSALIGPVLSMIDPWHTAEAQEPAPIKPAPIDGRRAYGYLKTICDLGPRIAGTEANAKQRQMVAEHFTKAGGKVREQHFTYPHPLTGRTVRMANLIGSWHLDRTERVLISAHYDTRPQADQEMDPDRLNKPFLGANDCASGVALLMEIANHLDKLETPWGVDLVLFDGEELVYGNQPRRGEYFLGSTIFARDYAQQRRRGGPRVHYAHGILLDMVGGKNATIRREQNSQQAAPDLMRQVWAVARQLDSKVFVNEVGENVMDDHGPLNAGGIPTIDLIDFPWEHWHTIDDVPENCSAESLTDVGRVVAGWLSLPRAPTRRGRR